jgi:hypothetical protein
MSDTLEQAVVVEQNTVITSTETTEVVITGIMGPPGENGVTTLSQLRDLDTTQLTDGATLVYRASDTTWKATNKLDNQILEAGQF